MKHRGWPCICVLRPVVLLPVVLLLPCCISTSEVLQPKPLTNGSPAELAARARHESSQRPRSEARMQGAFRMMQDAARATPAGDGARIPRLVEATRLALWLARHGREAAGRERHADAAIVLCNTLAQEAPDRVEGCYYRAVAVGMFARENNLYGADAMGQIRDDGRRAIQIDAGFEGAGPHRVLGALYLRAPGPPAGVGSLRRAIRHLETAVRLAPGQPENVLFLAEAWLADGRDPQEVARLLEPLPAAIQAHGDAADRALWTRRFNELQAKVRKQP